MPELPEVERARAAIESGALAADRSETLASLRIQAPSEGERGGDAGCFGGARSARAFLPSPEPSSNEMPELRARRALLTAGNGEAREVPEMHASDRALIELARRQHGVVSRAQMHAIGLDRGAIARRAARGLLRRLHCGVFLVGPLEARLTGAAAAVLACGGRAVLAGRTAGAIWRLIEHRDAEIDVLVGTRARLGPGIRVRQTSSLDARDVTRHEGLRITTPARTLLDLARTLRPPELARAIEQAQILHRVSVAAVEDVLRRHRGCPGVRALRAALAKQREPRLTRSQAERRLLDILSSSSLPLPTTNVKVEGVEVDALWREQRLVVEVDGHAFHGTREAFERDRRRDAKLQAASYRVVRLTYRRLVDEPFAVATQLAVLLARLDQ